MATVSMMLLVFILWLISFGLIISIDWLKGVADEKVDKKKRQEKARFKGIL
jgi:hypothetical protein